MKHIPIDYNRYLRADVIELVLLPAELAGLRAHDIVVAEGEDGIPDRKAEVLAIDGPRITLRFLEPLPAAG